MSVTRALLTSAALCWPLGGPWLAAVSGQVLALPPSTASAVPLDFYDPAPTDLAPQSLDLVDDPIQARLSEIHPTWQFLPDELLYGSYLAGGREPRFASVLFHERDQGWLSDVTLGSRVGLLRYGGHLVGVSPVWWQLDIEAAAFPRVTLDEHRDLVSSDFRYGAPLTFRRGPLETKFSYYHMSSHLSDEYLVAHPTATRVNFVRDVLVLGVALRPNEDLRLYAEAGWAFHTDGGSRPWEFQFGVDYSPGGPVGAYGAPFLALNTRLREEVDFGGNFTVQTGWQWRSQNGRLFRVGFHYLNGMSDQYQFYTEHEEQIGFGLWYDY